MTEQFRILYTLEEPSTNLMDSPKVDCNSINLTLEFELFIPQGEKKKKYRFIFRNGRGFHLDSSIFSHKHRSDAYDNLIEVLDSDWLKSINDLGYEMINLKKGDLHHYMIYFDSIGVYEFVAQSFKVEEVK